MGRAYSFVQHSVFYFVYFATLGIFLPFWSVYLYQRGLTHFQIGILTSLSAAVKIFAPVLWGWLADQKLGRISVIRVGAFFTWLIFVLIFLPLSFFGLLVVMTLFWFFWNAILTQFEVLMLDELRASQSPALYSQIRLWGSIGFLIMVLWGGALIEWAHIANFPYLVLVGVVAIWLCAMGLKAPQAVTSSASQNLVVEPIIDSQNHSLSGSVIKNLTFQKDKNLLIFLLAGLFMQIGFGAYYAFFSLFLVEHGYSLGDVGTFWAVGVFAEIVFFMLLPRFFYRVSSLTWVRIGLFLAGIRWVMTQYFVDHLFFLLLSQTLHAFTFGAFHVGAIYWVNHYFGDSAKGRGQALYSAVTYGVGGCIGAYVAGVIWDHALTDYLYLFSGVMSLLGLLIILRLKIN